MSSSQRVTFSGSVSFGDDFELDLRAYELRRASRPLKLERIPMELLLLLVERRGELVTREEIVERVWSKDVFLDTDNSINAAIRKIRQALKDDPERPLFVQTVTGRGYRFIAPVEAVISPGNPPVEISTPLSDGHLIGKKVSHYRVLKVLGGGGMGVVYQAEDLKLGRRVALKFLPTELASDPNAFRRLQSEARAASALDHPNICAIYELGEHEGLPFIAMQLLEGRTLREWIESRSNQTGPLPMDEVLDLAIQIATGLEAAHQRGVIHRDIKPANIFITAQGRAKILDFGVAKFMDTADAIPEIKVSGITRINPVVSPTGISFGTPSYVSPEQVRGEKLDGRSDLFSLGLVLYEMATGQKAFLGETIQAVHEAVLNQPATPIRQINPVLCPQLEKIVGRALEKDRERRYQSAGELRSDAERLKESLRPKPIFPRKKRWAPIVAAAAMVFFVALYFVAIRPQNRLADQLTGSTAQAKSRRSVAVLGFKNLSGKNDTAWLSPALEEMFVTELAAGQQLRIVPDESVARMKADLSLPAADSFGQETLGRIRTHLNTDLVVLGSYLAMGEQSGGKVRLDLKLQDTRSGETIGVVSSEGSESDLAELVSRSGAGMRETLGLDAVSSGDAVAVSASIPANTEAARLYAEGLSRLHNFDALAARELLERAIAAEPTHALSHSALARSLSDLGYDAKATAEAKLAFDLSAGLSRADRLLVEGRYRELTHDYPAAIEIYRTLHNFFPDDFRYALTLAFAQTKGGLAKDALQTVAHMRNLPGPENKDAQIDLAEAAAYQALGDVKQCQRAAAASVARAEAQGSKLIMAAALNTEAWAFSRMGAEDKALAALSRALQLTTQSGNRRAAASVRHGIAISQYNQGKFSQAQKSYVEALEEFRSLGATWDVASCSHNLGILLFDQGELATSKKYLEDALRIQREINDDRGVASDLDDLGNVIESMGDLSGALRMKQEAVQLFHRTGDRKGEAITLGAIGAIQLKQGNIVEARKSYEQSLEIKQKNGDSRGQAYALFGIAYVAMAEDRLNDAQNAAARALTIRQQIQDNVRSAEAQSQLAEIALEQGRAHDAESLARSAAPILEQSKVPTSAAYCNTILARAFIAQNKMKEAQTTSSRALAFSRQAGDFATSSDTTLMMANLGARSGKSVEASKALQSLERDAIKRGFVSTAFTARLRLGQIELSSGNSSAGEARLAQLRDEAQQKGLLLISRQAAAALKEVPRQPRVEARK